jgi:hypothetical protein
LLLGTHTGLPWSRWRSAETHVLRVRFVRRPVGSPVWNEIPCRHLDGVLQCSQPRGRIERCFDQSAGPSFAADFSTCSYHDDQQADQRSHPSEPAPDLQRSPTVQSLYEAHPATSSTQRSRRAISVDCVTKAVLFSQISGRSLSAGSSGRDRRACYLQQKALSRRHW